MKTILMCYEERPVSGRVVERTAELAKAFGAKVLVTSVAPVLHGRGGGVDPADSPARHEAEIDEAVTRLAEYGVPEIEGLPAIGDPADVIVRLADERAVDLVVVGAHEGGVVSRIVQGSVGDDVAHNAHADVLIVR